MKSRQWWPWLVLLTLFACGVALRLFRLGDQSLFTDEGVSWAVSLLNPGEIMAMSEFDHHAPLYFFLLKLAQAVLPATEVGVRAISVLASAAALLTVLAFLNREWRLSAAVYAGVLMVLSTFDLYYAQEARMYTLLAALWVIGYVALINACRGSGKWLAVWALTGIALPWTHMYGFLVLGANVAFVVAALVLRRAGQLEVRLDERLWLVTLAVMAVAVLPMARILLLHSDTVSLGAAVAHPRDVRDLFLLWSVGLTAARHLFLDSAHLALPATAALPPLVWLLAGLLIAGGPAAYGMARAWRMDGDRRLQVLLGLTNLFLPALAAFSYSLLLHNRIWIMRPFLGAAYLLYLWAGIGFSFIKLSRLRWALVPLAVGVALASLLPYFTTWQKSDARQAWTTMPQPDAQNVPVLGMRFPASQARFYLGLDAPLLTIEADTAGMPGVVRPVFGEGHAYHKVMGKPTPLSCDELAPDAAFWLYSNSSLIREMLPQLPSCLTGRPLWLFEDGRWVALDPVARDEIRGEGWLQFDDIRNSDWTTETYRHLNPGEETRLTFRPDAAGDHALIMRYFDYQGKRLEVWANRELLAAVGGGQGNRGWVSETVPLPAGSSDDISIAIRSVGTDGAGIAYLGIFPASKVTLGPAD